MIKSIAISPNELGHHPSLLTQMMQYNPTVASSDDTDFLVTCDNGDVLAIERKSPNDFLASIVDGRIKSQVEKMKAITKWTYIVITGDLKTAFNGHNERIADSRHKWTIGKTEGMKMTVIEMACIPIHCDGEDDFIPRLGTGVSHQPFGMYGAGNRKPVFKLGINDGVSPDERYLGLSHLIYAASEDILQNRNIQGFRWETNDVHGCQRLTAHSVDIAQGIGDGNLPEHVGVIDYGREEIDCLNDSQLIR